MQKVGGAVLVVLGIRLFLTKPADEKAKTGSARSNLGLVLSTFFLTLTNPMTFLAFGAIFATMGLGATKGHSILTVDLVAGVTLGALAWWTLLVFAVHAVRRRFTYSKLVWVNRGAGIFVVAVGILYIFVLHGEAAGTRFQNVPPLFSPRRKLADQTCRHVSGDVVGKSDARRGARLSGHRRQISPSGHLTI